MPKLEDDVEPLLSMLAGRERARRSVGFDRARGIATRDELRLRDDGNAPSLAGVGRSGDGRRSIRRSRRNEKGVVAKSHRSGLPLILVLAVMPDPFRIVRFCNYAGDVVHFVVLKFYYDREIAAVPSAERPPLVVFNWGGMIWAPLCQ